MIKLNFLTEKKNSAKKCSWGLKMQFFFFFFQKCSWGSETHAQGGGGGGGILGCLGRPTRAVEKRYTSSFDHDM